MKRYALLTAILAVLIAAPTMNAADNFPWPSDYVRNNVRDWHVNGSREESGADPSFRLLTDVLFELSVSADKRDNEIAVMIRDKWIAAAGLPVNEQGEAVVARGYEKELDAAIRQLSGVVDSGALEKIRAELEATLAREFVPKDDTAQ